MGGGRFYQDCIHAIYCMKVDLTAVLSWDVVSNQVYTPVQLEGRYKSRRVATVILYCVNVRVRVLYCSLSGVGAERLENRTNQYQF
jgi:hypothetical protein